MREKKTIYYIAIVVMAGVTSGVIAITPMIMAVPKFIYASIIPTALVSMGIGPIAGGVYAVAISYILNNIGIGSGVIFYVLILQVIEAVLIGIIWKNRINYIAKCVGSIIGLTFVLKPISYLLFYIFNWKMMEDITCINYLRKMYGNYLKIGWKDTMMIYSFSIIVSCMIVYIFYKFINRKGIKTK